MSFNNSQQESTDMSNMSLTDQLIQCVNTPNTSIVIFVLAVDFQKRVLLPVSNHRTAQALCSILGSLQTDVE